MKKAFKNIGQGLWRYTRWVSKQTSALLNALLILVISSSIGTIAGTVLLVGVLLLGSYEVALEEHRNLVFNEMTENLLLIDGKSGEILLEN